MTVRAHEVSFKKNALKELRALPARIQQIVLDAVQLLALNPYTELLHIKKLKGADSLYRFRIQDYRVIYSLDRERIRIIVIKVGHRKEVYD